MAYHTRDELNEMVDNDHTSDDETLPETPNRAGGVWVHPKVGLTPLEMLEGMTSFPCPEMTCPMAAQLGPVEPPNTPPLDEYLDSHAVPGPAGVFMCSECGMVVFGLESTREVREAREKYGDADRDSPPWAGRTV